MTTKERRLLRRLINKLGDARDAADMLEINLGNGADVGNMLGAILDELELKEQDL